MPLLLHSRLRRCCVLHLGVLAHQVLMLGNQVLVLGNQMLVLVPVLEQQMLVVLVLVLVLVLMHQMLVLTGLRQFGSIPFRHTCH